MHEILKLILLGTIQGITEFLPISSSGHLVITKTFLALPSEGVLLEVALHGGTLLAIFVYYRERLWGTIRGVVTRDPDSVRLAILIVVATLPTVVVYVAARDVLDRAYQSPVAAATALCVTGIVLLLPVRSRPAASEGVPSLAAAFLIGVAQAVAVMPGISRSGSTIVTARHLGVAPGAAAEFSFLMAVPVLSGAMLLELPKLRDAASAAVSPAGLVVGIVTSAVVGYVSLVLLIKLLRKGTFWVFGVYCLIVGLTALAIHLV